jgi:excinuclease ABC subunit A
LIFDEPSSGLSDHDVLVFVKILQDLADQGHTVIVIEHHVGVLKAVDWIVELGPGPGEAGGEIVYSGPVDKIIQAPSSNTAEYLV